MHREEPSPGDARGSLLVEILRALADRRELSSAQMTAFISDLVTGTQDEVYAGAILTGLRVKGETGLELAAAARVLRGRMIRLESGRTRVLDTCGTGGDETGTFNISTATALVAAAAGVPVVKHGNRSVSSRSGSADVLACLGVSIPKDASQARQCLEQAGVAFCFAPYFHPAMASVAALRRKLGIRTLFNCVGPLTNPADAEFQLLGVGRQDLLDPMASALGELGTQHAFLVCGSDGLDEVSLSGLTMVREVTGKEVRTFVWRPSDFGLAPCSLQELKVEGPEESSYVIQSILSGTESAAARVVMANTAAALLVVQLVDDLRQGVIRAREAIVSGRAWQVLEKMIACSSAAK